MDSIITAIKNVYNITKVNVSICDKDFIDKNLLKEENVTDFPTIIIYDNNYKKSIKFLGTVPFIQIQQEIDRLINK